MKLQPPQGQVAGFAPQFKLTIPYPTGCGFTLIELIIVLAVIAILLSLAVPAYQDYSIRAKVGEALSVANSAKTAVSATCHEDLTIASLTNAQAGYNFVPGGQDSDYVDNVQASGPCTTPVVTVTTSNTGAAVDPILVLTGQLALGSGQIRWQCMSTNTPFHLLPDTCRS